MAYIPHRIRVPTHEANSCWGWGLWGGRKWQPDEGENEGRRKKEEIRKNEEERGQRPMYNTRVPTRLAPLVHYKVPGRLTPLLVGPGARSKCTRPNGAL
jgi:hypothetical protein